ncbi:MAG: phosphate starvation-inducible PhoH-like protein, partial [Pseudohongiellaceae bacterium]
MPTLTLNLTLVPNNAQRLAILCGRLNEHITQIESFLSLKIRQRGNVFQISGPESAVNGASKVLEDLYKETEQNPDLSPNQVHLALQEIRSRDGQTIDDGEELVLKTPRSSVKPRNSHQQDYVKSIWRYDINFG